MKKEKVFVMVALTVITGALYAQTPGTIDEINPSNPSVPLVSPKSQSGLVGYVDDYMDVNFWQDVEFDKIFAHLGYNSSEGFNTGVATNFNDVYAGFFFCGNFLDFMSRGETYRAYSQSHVESAGARSLQLSSLIGFGNVGIRPSIFLNSVHPNSNYHSSHTENGYVDESYSSDFEVYPELRAGFNADVSGFGLTPHAYFGVDFKLNKSKRNMHLDEITDNSRTWIMLGFGSGFDFPVRDGSAFAMSLDADFDFAFATEKNSSLELETDSKAGISLGWTGEFFPTDKVSIKLKASLPVDFLFLSVTDYVGFKMSGQSSTSARLRYQASQKLALKLATSMSLPDFAVITQRSSFSDTEQSKRWAVSFGQKTSFALTFYGGFYLDIVPNITLDCGWSFGGNLLNNYLGSMKDLQFWGGVSKIFSDIQLGLSVRI
ncbi:MAG: hypothetical protein J1F14_06480 [Treponema sp.]|nr:hypothetical protein [Treponema sp.]